MNEDHARQEKARTGVPGLDDVLGALLPRLLERPEGFFDARRFAEERDELRRVLDRHVRAHRCERRRRVRRVAEKHGTAAPPGADRRDVGEGSVLHLGLRRRLDGGTRGLNPSIRFETPQSGRYEIWVGTYGSATLRNARLHISELYSQ